MAKILWAVTGAGQWMRESAKIFEEVAQEHEVTVIFSRSGYEVARLYGVLKIFEKYTGGYYREMEVDPQPLSHVYGRVMSRKYDLTILAPATANTIAKIAYGIADNLITTTFAMARKSKTPSIILPTDAPWVKKTTLPCLIRNCLKCEICPPQEVCPTQAIENVKGNRRIILSKCIGCEACVSSCPFGAISCFEEVEMNMDELDVLNLIKVMRLGFIVVHDPSELRSKIREVLMS
ncbi:hypothetical protein IPA_04475 [Ignicoccus pacificus DSM 13166]|uniref:4Fe-4S ferredoxin-type domain-containing protein n=1 Tax=Ignicoccus pacificus DSM 13166 TaxID=940294 RepID=A0A977K9F3_9CREN|nr:hypothetical protein IPA_04475 [Ignicoccus pacificus DSM 13166]